MSGLRLYGRCRRVLAAAGALVLILALAAVFGARAVRLRDSAEVLVPLLLLAPLLAACVIGMSLRSAMHDVDATAARALAPLRLTQIAVLLLPTAAALATLGAQVDGPISVTAVLRNLAGLTGLALLSGRVIGGRLTWLVPAVWTMCALSLGDPRSSLPPWDWPIRYDHDLPALILALALFAAGLAAGATGTRETRAEID